MADYYGLTAEVYQGVTALIDERMKSMTVTAGDFNYLAGRQIHLFSRVDGLESVLKQLAQAQLHTEIEVKKLTQAQARTEKRVEELAQAQARTEKRVEELAQAQARTETRLDQLTQRVEELAQAQARTEKRLDQLTQRVEELAQAQARTEKRVEELAQAQARTEKRVEELAQAQARTETRVEELAQAQARTEQELRDLTKVVEDILKTQAVMQQDIRQLQNEVAQLSGDSLEERYWKHAGAYFGRVMRKVRGFKPYQLQEELEERLSSASEEELSRADVLIRGRPKKYNEAPEVWLVTEVSVVIDKKDVERAKRRAACMREGGYLAMPAVAGRRFTKGAEAEVAKEEVVVVTNGHISFWDEALARVLPLDSLS